MLKAGRGSALLFEPQTWLTRTATFHYSILLINILRHGHIAGEEQLARKLAKL